MIISDIPGPGYQYSAAGLKYKSVSTVLILFQSTNQPIICEGCNARPRSLSVNLKPESDQYLLKLRKRFFKFLILKFKVENIEKLQYLTSKILTFFSLETWLSIKTEVDPERDRTNLC